MNEELTEEQEWQILWEKCLEMEKKMSLPIVDSRDKAIDWDTERYLWDKWNPRNLK